MKLPATTSRELVRVLEQRGYARERDQKAGGHVTYCDGVRRVQVPHHGGGKDLWHVTLRTILRKAEVSEDEFLKLRKD